jgi:hypothetical protein
MPYELIAHITLLLGLLNKQYFTSNPVQESLSFTRLPPEYGKYIEELYDTSDSTMFQQSKIAIALGESVIAFLEKELGRSFISKELSV